MCMTLTLGSTIVIALGGNALLERGQKATGTTQRHNIARAAAAIAPLLEKYRIIITHGNGPQVGLLAAQSSASFWPLDVLGAESEGMIGYVIEQELANRAQRRHFATLLTQVVVAVDDRAFEKPTKPIGLVLHDPIEMTAQGWTSIAESDGWRRVVASPTPLAIMNLEAIKILVAANVTVICLGGGGIPIAVDHSGQARGIEAVIDKDSASALLARELGADALIMLTDVEGIIADFGTKDARRIEHTTPQKLKPLVFAPGTMGPKVEAAISMAEIGKIAMIGALGSLDAILAGTAGTWVTSNGNQTFQSLICSNKAAWSEKG
jgi:carbamate kinase